MEESSRRSGKSDSAFRTISEVSNELNVPQHVLRFWETKFSQIRPMKRGGGRRYYRPEDVTLLAAIRDLLYNDGYTIKGAQKLLRENGVKSVISHTEGLREGEAPDDVDDREPTFSFDSEPKKDDPSPEEGYPEDLDEEEAAGAQVKDESGEDPLRSSPLMDVTGQPEDIPTKPERLSQSGEGTPVADGNPSLLSTSPEEREAPSVTGLSDDQRLELEVVLSDLQDLRRILRQVDL